MASDVQDQLGGTNDSRAPQGDQTYTVQQRRELLLQMVEGDSVDSNGLPAPRVAWVDIATVTVPPRTIRTTVVKRAFEQAGITVPVGERHDVRVLDADSARVIPVGSKQPPPELVIGDVA